MSRVWKPACVVAARIALTALAALEFGCGSTDSDPSGRLVSFYYRDALPGGYRLDVLRTIHLESDGGYSAFRVFPLATRQAYRSGDHETTRLREQFGIEFLLPLWNRDRDEDRSRLRLVSLFGFDELSLYRHDLHTETTSERGERSSLDWTFLPFVGDGNVFFRYRSVDLTGTSDGEHTLAVDFGRWFWGWLFEMVEYRSSVPLDGSTRAESHDLNVFRVVNGYLILLRDHSIEDVESDFRFVGVFETVKHQPSLFRIRRSFDQSTGAETSRIEALWPLVEWETRPNGRYVKVFPLFSFDREGEQRVVRLFHLFPIRF